MAQFQPVGDEPRWRIVYRVLCRYQPGQVVTYEVLGSELGLDPAAPSGRSIIQAAVRRAGQDYAHHDRRALEPVPNLGYRVAEAADHLTLARRHQGRATRAVRRGEDVATYVDLTGVSPAVRDGLALMARAFAGQAEFMRALDVRQRRLESALTAVTTKAANTDEQVAALTARLARLEAANEGSTDD